MNSLLSILDTPISEADVEAATLAIQAAAPSIKVGGGGYPSVTYTTRPPSNLLAEFELAQLLYANADWYSLMFKIDDLMRARAPLPKELVLRRHLSSCLVSTLEGSKASYKILAGYRRQMAGNGDIYLGLAALKLQRLYLPDVEALLQLAQLCPIYHPELPKLLKYRLQWVKTSYISTVLQFSIMFKTPGLIAEAKETIPEMQMCKEAAELERKFPLLPASDMYADVFAWTSTAAAARMWSFHVSDDRLIAFAESSFEKLPKNVFDRILEYCSLSSMGAVSSLNSLLRTRIERSNAWHWHSPLQLGITPSPQTDGAAPPFDVFIIGNIREVLRLSICLRDANLFDASSFDPIINSLISASAIEVSVAPTSLPVTGALRVFVQHLTSLITPINDPQGILAQYLCSQSDIHLTLARMTRTFSDLSHVFVPAILALVTSKAKDAPKWIEQLRSVNFDHCLRIMEAGELETLSFSLVAFLEHNHFIDRCETRENIGHHIYESLNTVLAEESESTVLEDCVAGVWHLLWYPHHLNPIDLNLPNYGSFRIPRQMKIVREGQAEDMSDTALGPGGPGFSFAGPGHVVSRDSKFHEVRINCRATVPYDPSQGLQFDFQVSGLPYLFSGTGALGVAIGGSFMDPNLHDPTQRKVSEGYFMLWKSSVEDTTENWQAKIEEVKTYAAHRKAELAHYHGPSNLSPSWALATEPYYEELPSRRYPIGISANIGLASTPNDFSVTLNLAEVTGFIGYNVDDVIALAPNIYLPAAPFETELSVRFRVATYDRMLSEFDDTPSLQSMSHAHLAGDLFSVLERIVELYTTLLEEYGLVKANSATEAVRRRIADFEAVYGETFLEDLIEHINVIQPLASRLPGLQRPTSLDGTDASMALLADIKQVLAIANDHRGSAANLFERSCALERILQWELEEDSKPLPPAPSSAPTSLLQRISDLQAYRGQISKVAALHQRTLRHMLLIRPLIDNYLPQTTIERLGIDLVRSLICTYVHERERLLEEVEELEEDDLPELDLNAERTAPDMSTILSGVTSKKSKRSITSINPTILCLVGLGVAVCAVAAFALGRKGRAQS